MTLHTTQGEVGPVEVSSIRGDGEALQIGDQLRLKPSELKSAEVWDVDRRERREVIASYLILAGVIVTVALGVLIGSGISNGLQQLRSPASCAPDCGF